MKIFYFAILFSSILLIFGCSKEDDKKTNFVRTPDNTVLEGTWKTDCITSGAYTIIMSIEITGTTGVYKQEWHGGSGCSTDVWTTDITYTTYTVGNKIDYTDNTSGYEIYAVVDSQTDVPLHSTITTGYNNTTWCGYDDWVINTTKDVTGKTCGATTFDNKGTEGYSISKLVGTSLNVSSWYTTNIADSVTTITYTKQ